MQISFFGAAGEVTGSCSLLDSRENKILVDCGMFQGSHFNEDKNHEALAFDPASLTAVLVTHAHLDHVGRLPLLIKGGYDGFFYATPPTVELAMLILEDALHVMTENSRKYGTPVLYESSDIAKVMEQFKTVDYYEELKLNGGASAKFHEAGHIFGSAFAEITIEGKKIVFSGDVGNVNAPILRDTDRLPDDLDILVCESTYGNHIHEPAAMRQQIIKSTVIEAAKRGGVLMIPAFSLERTQELLYELHELADIKKVLPKIPIYLDSPLAINATKVYRKYIEYYDAEAENLLKMGEDFFQFPGLIMTPTTEESKKINATPGPKIIIAGSGMMNGGRIQHHAMRYLPDKNNTLLIVGYMANGTVGRRILDGAASVEIYRETIPVRCSVKAIGAMSAHGDQIKLIQWAKSGNVLPKQIFLNHGEPNESQGLARKLMEAGAKVTVVEKSMKKEI